MPFPVYWFDFSYNIFKRARQELSKENPAVIEQDKMFRYMKKLYKYLGDQMELQKNFYKYEGKNREKEDESDDLSGSPDYLDEMFKKCPVVRYFLDDGEGSADEQRKEKFITGVLGKLRGFSESV